jgi:hypothetical protein
MGPITILPVFQRERARAKGRADNSDTGLDIDTSLRTTALSAGGQGDASCSHVKDALHR